MLETLEFPIVTHPARRIMQAFCSRTFGRAHVTDDPLRLAEPISTGAGTPSSVIAAEDRVLRSGGEWFVSPDDAVNDDPRITNLRPRSRAWIGIVLFGVAAAVAATLFMTRSDEAVASSTPVAETVATTTAPVTEPAPAVTRTEVAIEAPREATTIKGTPTEVPGENTQAATTAAATKAIDTGARAKPSRQTVTKAAKARPKAQPTRRPAARPSTTTPSAPTSDSAPAEDLYDTR